MTATKKIKHLTKTEMAARLGISRGMLYYQRKQPLIDQEVKLQIESVWVNHPAYGHKRLALALKLNKKRILRVMKIFGLTPKRKRGKKPQKKGDQNKPASQYQNLIKGICPIAPDCIWVTDFTYIKYHHYFIYLATIIDLFTREVVGWNISRFHNKELVLGAFNHALTNPNHHLPLFHHSDQGSEYDSQDYTTTVEKLNIQVSMSHKASPWENGYQESFYSQFKLDLGDPNRFNELGELIEAIHTTINYHNHDRIHTSLKMTPQQKRKQYYEKQKPSDSAFRKLGT